MCIIVFTTTILTVNANNSYICGDVNGDGKITVADIIAIQKKLLSVKVNGFDEKVADVDSNGLKLSDAVYIQRYLTSYNNNPYRILETVYNNDDKYELPFIPVG